MAKKAAVQADKDAAAAKVAAAAEDAAWKVGSKSTSKSDAQMAA